MADFVLEPKEPSAPPAPTPPAPAQPGPSQQPVAQPADEGISQVRTLSPVGNIVDEMRGITGEDPEKTFKPLITRVEREKENSSAQPPATPPATPTPPEPPATPPASPPPEPPAQPEEGVLEAGGRKFKSVAELQKSYDELNRKFGKTQFEHQQETRRLELEMKRIDNDRAMLEKLTVAGVMRDVQAQRSGNAPASATKQLNMDELNAALAGDNPGAAIQELISSQLAANEERRTQTVQQIQKERAEKDAELQREVIARNIEDARNSEEMKSFAENQKIFGEWMGKLFGTNESGLVRINEICSKPAELKQFYQTFLKDTFDFTTAIQRAKAEGEAVASVKESLAPVPTPSGTPPKERGQPQQPVLTPVDKDVTDMESVLSGGRRGGSFFNKEGLFR